MSRPLIKICGLSRPCDIDYANEYRPDFIGFVFAESRRQVSCDTAAELKSRLSPNIKSVGVFVNDDMDRIAALAESGVIDLVQLHGTEDNEYLSELKGRISLPVIRAVSVGSSDERQRLDSCADYILLDNKGGGTGQTFDWSAAPKTDKPVFLAGGINISNVSDGIASFHPYAVDISGGVETDGFKDPIKIKNIIRRIRDE